MTTLAPSFRTPFPFPGAAAALALAVLAPGAAARQAVCSEEEQQLLAPDGEEGDQLGFAVALDGDTALVGAYLDDDAGASSGAAYVFVRSGSTWSLQQKLTAPDAAATDRFGASVALVGDTALVGAPFDDAGATDDGSAYAFVRSGASWTFQQKLLASDGGGGDLFGAVVALSGGTALIGAPLHDRSALLPDAGAAYVFVGSGASWGEQAKLVPSDPGAPMDGFGSTVALDADTALVGVPSDDDAGTSSGSTYVFTRTGTSWSQQQKLTASDAAAVDTFGDAVAVLGDTALIGSPRDDDGATDAGSAYVFVRAGSSWSEAAKLTSSSPGGGDFFGLTTALAPGTALIGARLDDDAGTNSGSATFFLGAGSAWTEAGRILASDAAMGDVFSSALALSGDTALVGAFGSDASGTNSGAAYAFRFASAMASQTPFDGTLPNPPALLPAAGGGPVVGTVWGPSIDHASFFPTAIADVLFVSLDPPLDLPTPFGTLLCTVPPAGQIFAGPAGVAFAVPVPSDCSLVGLAACAQGAGFLPGSPIELTNGLALVLGSW